MNERVVAASHVTKEFVTQAERLVILRDVNLDVMGGQTLAITGESGSGKSTLLSIIGGLDRASSGTIESGGHALHELDEEGLTQYRRTQVGFIFQFHYLLKDFTTLENVMLAGFMNGMSKRKASAKAADILSDVGLSSRLAHFPSQLSGGERQRAAVARALMNDPALILADEPTGNLDEANSATVAGILFETVKKRGKALVLVTHDRGLAATCDESLLLREGELAPL
jgi:lipoprotein-releasing system ATP-binding protein